MVAYGEAPQQDAELRLPKGAGPHPVVILVHGGCWEAPWALDHVRSLAAALTAEGFATWSLEYRRLGDPGGGWPGTLADVARGADHLRTVAARARLDLARVVASATRPAGISRSGSRRRRRLPKDSAPLEPPTPLPLRGVVSLAGITDLRAARGGEVCGDAVSRLLGGPPAERATACASRRRSSSSRSACRSGSSAARSTRSCRTTSRARTRRPRRRRATPSTCEVVEGVGHFELVDPMSAAWPPCFRRRPRATSASRGPVPRAPARRSFEWDSRSSRALSSFAQAGEEQHR